MTIYETACGVAAPQAADSTLQDAGSDERDQIIIAHRPVDNASEWHRLRIKRGAALADILLFARLRPPSDRAAIELHNQTVTTALLAWGWPRWLQGSSMAARSAVCASGRAS